ncbi:DUF805 domain-containing protein [Aequorivita viscosa]|uniref:Uncharacterized membrane protein YhaH, DUF805 family n=1 Tax=Aequorivita viscosa TaxID=797419 RepID=A0A1M6M8B7_9FLAO|nr:DUF805 domain-containing protein [Aequorivita viscosa]SDX28094.1 Uncharacterized membrane protein YhaH, DUF805 family [Aequorivita viscosa]SHJ79705.1 Uncharacterized membrane protein YhaH, DUF805 family [Aequorivita viscosa]
MFKNPFSFRGRIRRTEFGVSYVIVLVSIFSMVFLVDWLEITGVHLSIHLATIYWFSFSQGAKRCHDMGKNGFYQLIPFYIFVMIFSKGENRRNKYGQDPILTELRDKESPPPVKSQKIILPQGKQMQALGSELLSGVLLTVLAVAFVIYFYDKIGWLYFILQSILIMGGYYLVLIFSFRTIAFSQLTKFFLIHRALFSLGFYLFLRSFESYSYQVTDFNFSTLAGDISNFIAIFTLTYLPYLIFKPKQTPSLIPLEA